MSPEMYRYLIAELTHTVTQAGGRMKRLDAERATARRLEMSIADMQGISINAHADKTLVYDLRTDSLVQIDNYGNSWSWLEEALHLFPLVAGQEFVFYDGSN